MKQLEHYARHARECREAAANAVLPEIRAVLLKMAERWEELARQRAAYMHLEDMLAELLKNLVSNAVHHSPKRGALGIVIPHVDTAEEAKEIADRLRYPPRGHRSVGGGQAQFDYAPMKMADMTRRANDNTLITVMIETPKAVRNAEAIAAVPGIDALLVGSSDLSVELGIPGENGHPKIQEAVDKVVAACKKHRKFPGMGGAYSEELLQLYIGKGMKMLLAGNDLPMLVNAARAHQAKVRAMATVRAKPKAAAKKKR